MMKKYNFLSVFASLALLAALPYIASAHERRVYQIGPKDYAFVVGFLNEPVSVDDKTGVDLTVILGNGTPTMGPDGDMDGPPANMQPVSGLEKNLKVEISAGSKKKVLDLVPTYGMPGHYHAVFYPSLETTYTFRIFGNVDSVPVDLSFPCNTSGQAPAMDSVMTKVSDGVIRKSKSGAFGCPAPKTDQVFPTQKVTLSGLDRQIGDVNAAVAGADIKGMAGIILGALGLIAGLGAWMKRTRS